MKHGMNIGHEMLSGVSYPEWITDDVRLFKMRGFNHFRVAMSDHRNANAILFQKLYIKRIRELLPQATFIFGVNKIGNQWRSSQWPELRLKHIESANYAQQNNLSFQLFNEDTNVWCIADEKIKSSTKSGQYITVETVEKHSYMAGDSITIINIGNLMMRDGQIVSASGERVFDVVDDFHFRFKPAWPGQDGVSTGGLIRVNPSVIRDRYKTLATELRSSGITVPIIGSVAQGGLPLWLSGGGTITLALNVYGEGTTLASRLASFKSQVDQFILIPQPVGALKMVTEYGINAAYSSYPTDYNTQVSELKQRRVYLDGKVDRHYFFNWRSDSNSTNQSDAFAMRMTWNGGQHAPLNIRWTEIFDN